MREAIDHCLSNSVLLWVICGDSSSIAQVHEALPQKKKPSPSLSLSLSLSKLDIQYYTRQYCTDEDGVNQLKAHFVSLKKFEDLFFGY